MIDHHHTTFSPATKRPRSINERSNVPFYIRAPDYRNSSAGIRVLHYLCHILNEMGEEAYLVGTQVTSPRLRTPVLTLKQLEEHFMAGQTPVTLYPEVVSDNPANTPLIARWLLNMPGHLGKDIDFEPEDLIFYYDAWCLPPQMSGQPLFIHPVDESVFHNDDNPDDAARTLECYYANKYFLGQRPLLPEHEQLVSLGQEIKRTPQEIANILRRSKVLYCYEPSAIICEAQACGCPVLLVRSDYLPLPDGDPHRSNPGLAVYGEADALAQARQSLRWIPAAHEAERDQSWALTQAMVETVYRKAEQFRQHGKPLRNEMQALWSLPLADRPAAAKRFREEYEESGLFALTHTSPERLFVPQRHSMTIKPEKQDCDYRRWREQRDALLARNAKNLGSSEAKRASFQLILQVAPEEGAMLAYTLDSLGTQLHAGWRLDVLTTLPAPEALTDIPCIGWHGLSAETDPAAVAARLVADSSEDWIIELPAGVQLDPLYLWRLATISDQSQATQAIFVDDDLYATDGQQHASARFKPGSNPEWLIASDHVGILAVRRQAWSRPPQPNRCAWHDQLFFVIANYGWAAVAHVPDVLLSYPDAFPYDEISHRNALSSFLSDRKTPAELLGTGLHSFCIRYLPEDAAAPLPLLSVAILYQADFILEHITDCLNSLLKYTAYPNIEIIISTVDARLDPKLQTLIAEKSNEAGKAIRIIALPAEVYGKFGKHTPAHAIHNALCNAAVDAAAAEFVLLLDEKAKIVQENWIDELLGTCRQPGVAAAVPRMIQPGSSRLEYAGDVLGMGGRIGTPYREAFRYNKDSIKPQWTETPHDLATLPDQGFLIRKSCYHAVGGMDPLAGDMAATDLGLKLRTRGERLVYQPLANLAFQKFTVTALPEAMETIAQTILDKAATQKTFMHRWWPTAAIDPFWNPNFSLFHNNARIESEYLADWQITPQPNLPRILTRPVTNGQGYFRISAPLNALQQAGKVQVCEWNQIDGGRPFIPSEILRLAPDSLIVQNYMNPSSLHSLEALYAAPGRPFTIFVMDDLMDGLAESNPLKVTVSENPRERLRSALAHCDRLVVSTDYLAEAYRHMIDDIRIVPNCLEQAIWLPLHSAKRTGKKPRIGWAGGTTHQDDLLLLKEIIEQTRHEADWIFMGMCPDEIRPLLTEFHPLTSMARYPAHLASLNLDIAVAPLAEIPFNRAKSNLRLLEYGILGIPVVCTDIDPYRNSPACRVVNTPKAWIAALRERMHDADAREHEGRAMRRWVQENFLLENNTDQWLTAHTNGQ